MGPIYIPHGNQFSVEEIIMAAVYTCYNYMASIVPCAWYIVSVWLCFHFFLLLFRWIDGFFLFCVLFISQKPAASIKISLAVRFLVKMDAMWYLFTRCERVSCAAVPLFTIACASEKNSGHMVRPNQMSWASMYWFIIHTRGIFQKYDNIHDKCVRDECRLIYQFQNV